MSDDPRAFQFACQFTREQDVAQFRISIGSPLTVALLLSIEVVQLQIGHLVCLRSGVDDATVRSGLEEREESLCHHEIA